MTGWKKVSFIKSTVQWVVHIVSCIILYIALFLALCFLVICVSKNLYCCLPLGLMAKVIITLLVKVIIPTGWGDGYGVQGWGKC